VCTRRAGGRGATCAPVRHKMRHGAPSVSTRHAKVLRGTAIALHATAPMLLRAPFAAVALALMAACSGQVASQGAGGDGGHENQDAGHPRPDGGGQPGHDAGRAGDAAGGPDSGLAPPTSHRPTHQSCMSTRPPGLQDGGGISFCGEQTGSCTNDSECPATNDAGGTNGRCTPSEDDGPAISCPSCQYDQCSTDSQCGAGSVCACGGDALSGRFPNACLSGNCQVDSDCGSGGYCSPNVGFCGEGTLGYYCHTADDECHNESDCQNNPNSFGGQCVYDTSKKIWDCQSEGCPG